MKKLKIGIMGSRGIPNNYGGFEQFAQYLSSGLQQRGHEVWVYNSHNHPYIKDRWEGVHIIHCRDWEQRIGTAGQFFYDRNCLADAGKRSFDVLLHLGYTSDSIWHRRWPESTVHIVNMDGLEWKRTKYNRITRWFLKKAEALAAKHADALVADSPAIQQYLADKYKKEVSFIPYAAEPLTNPEPSCLNKFQLHPLGYSLLIARIVPENNIETIIKGYLKAQKKIPLVIVGGINNRFGKHLVAAYSCPDIVFTGAVYDISFLNNLRYYSALYFHGHSVGGTNPSLLEAMACSCNIIAHDNTFNRAVLENDADYFSDEQSVAALLLEKTVMIPDEKRKAANIEKISSRYSTRKIIDEYESLMLKAVT